MENTTGFTSTTQFWKQLKRLGLLMTFFGLAFVSLSAQSTNDIWDEGDEDEEEEIVEEAPIEAPHERKSEASIWLNGVAFDPATEEITLHRNDTLEIMVRDLAPATSVVIQAEKGGINLSKKAFYANKKGELDLEIRLGNKKMKGKAKLLYTPSDGNRKQREVHIIVD